MGNHGRAHLYTLVTSSHEDLAHTTYSSASLIFSLWTISWNLANAGNKSIMSSTKVGKRQHRELHRGPAPHPLCCVPVCVCPQQRSRAEETKNLSFSWREAPSTMCLQHMTHSISLAPGQQCWGALLQAGLMTSLICFAKLLCFFNWLYWVNFF